MPKRMNPRIEQEVMGPGYADPRKRIPDVPLMDTDIYQCPSCGEITSSLSDRETIRCRKCGNEYFKYDARLADNEEMME
ncbi:MAG: zinc ribbon domain-containing protein [Candidatus Aenigmatarchaeota archaeon]